MILTRHSSSQRADYSRSSHLSCSRPGPWNSWNFEICPEMSWNLYIYPEIFTRFHNFFKNTHHFTYFTYE